MELRAAFCIWSTIQAYTFCLGAHPGCLSRKRNVTVRTGSAFHISRTTTTVNSSLLINMNRAEEPKKNSTEVHLRVYYSWRTTNCDTVTQSQSHWVKCISSAGSNYSLVLALWLIAMCAIHHPCYIYRILTSIMRSFVTTELAWNIYMESRRKHPSRIRLLRRSQKYRRCHDVIRVQNGP